MNTLNVGDAVRSKSTGSYGVITAVDEVRSMVVFKVNRTGSLIKASMFNFERVTVWDKVFYSGRFWLWVYVAMAILLVCHFALTS